MSGEGPFLIDGDLLTVSSQGRGGKGALWGPSDKTRIPFLKAPPSQVNHLPKAPPPHTITLGLGFTCEFLGDALRPLHIT